MYDRILVAVDGSRTSTTGLAEAIRIATSTGASVRLVHVLDALSYTNGFETPAVYCEEVLPHMKKEGSRILDEACKHVLEAGLEVSSVLIEKVTQRVSELVVAHASDCCAELIVVGSHGRRGIDRAMMGSDAEQIVRLAPVPVLVVKDAGESPRNAGQGLSSSVASC